MQSARDQREAKQLGRSVTTISGIQSPGRSGEARFSLAQAKRDLAADSQLCDTLLKACRLPQAIPKPVPLLSCFSGLTSRTRRICPATERSSVCLSSEECCAVNTFLALLGRPSARAAHPQEEPHTSTVKRVLQESRATGKQLPLGDWKPQEAPDEVCQEEEPRGDQREPYKVQLPALLKQEAGFASHGMQRCPRLSFPDCVSTYQIAGREQIQGGIRRLQDLCCWETPSTEQKQKGKKPVPGNKDELLQWSGVATFPKKRLPESHASTSLGQAVTVSSFVCPQDRELTAVITAGEVSERPSGSPPGGGQREARSSQIPLRLRTSHRGVRRSRA